MYHIYLITQGSELARRAKGSADFVRLFAVTANLVEANFYFRRMCVDKIRINW